MHNFRKLKVYQKALQFSKTVRVMTRRFPKDEMFSLTAQFRRAADIAFTNEYISEKAHQDVFSVVDEIVAMLIGLQRSILK